MKILKIKIKLIKQPNGIVSYNYPLSYDASKINILAYSDSVIINEEIIAYCIGIVNDKYINNFLNNNEDVVEISSQEADALGKVWRLPVLKILNEKLVVFIVNKIKQNIPLDKKEKEALDPNNYNTLGLNYSKNFNINDYIF